MRTKPKLRIPLLLSIAAVFAWTFAGWLKPSSDASESVRQTLDAFITLWQAITFLLIISTIWASVDLLTFTVISRWNQWTDAKTAAAWQHAEVLNQVADKIMAMSQEQLEAWGRQRVEIETVPSNVAPLNTIVFPTCRVSWEFVRTFIERGTETHLCPIRMYSEGSRHQEYAKAITDYFVMEQYAIPANGNEPAEWRSPKAREAGLKSIGWEE